jgi:hypothetical protein
LDIGIALPFLDLGARRGWVVRTTPPAALPPGKTRYPLYRRLGGPQGPSGQVRKISPTPGFDRRTIQPVASRYTDWATGPVISVIATQIYKQRNSKYLFRNLENIRNWKGLKLESVETKN